MAINVDISKITGINQVGNSYQRKSAVPLDYFSLFNTKAEAETYAASNPVSYVGQVISYIHEGEVKVCVIANTAGLLKEVGTAPKGDNKTIEVSAEGAVALLGASTAANGTLPMLGDDGKLTWKTLEQIGAGDGNDNTTYEFSFADQKITIKPLFNGQPIKKKDDEGNETEEIEIVTLDLSTFVTADELAEAIAALPEDKDTTYSVKNGEKVLKLNGTEFSTVLSLSYANNRISLTGINDEEIAGFDASAFVADGVLEDVSYNPETKDLTFTWNVLVENEQGEKVNKTDVINIADLIDTYTAGHGLQLSNSEFSIKLAEGSESFLSADENGLKLSGIQTAINTAKQEAIDAAATDATTKAGTAKSEAIADAATKYYGKSETYTKDEIDELLEGIQGGASESAASVNTKLEAYKKVVNAEVWGDDAGAGVDGNSRIDLAENRLTALENVGAQANVIEEVKGATENRLSVSTSGKVVTIDDANLRTDIANAKKAGTDAAQAASEAAAAASQNAQAIQGHATKIGNLETLTGTHSTDIANLQAADTTHNALYEALKTTVDGHTTQIASKADQSALDAAAQKASANEQAIKTLNETTVPAINSEIAKKADADKVYTKTEIGTIAENKTIVQMIADAQTAATYDDTKVKEDIQKNATAIEDITKADGAIATAVAAEAKIARAAEKKNADDIAAINALLNTVDSEDNITSLKELAIWVEEHGSEASEMAKSITANAEAIAAINNAETGILASAKAHSDANLATAKKYTDDSIAALLIKNVDNVTLKLDDNGVASVKAVSTDLLAQGENELILSAGNASGYNTTN